jgi:hypothetical protein
MSYDNVEFGLTDKESSPNREAANKHDKGSKKYREMISKQTRIENQKNLPYSFSAPKKSGARNVICQCPHCEDTTAVTKNTIMVICGQCKKSYSVTEENTLKK